MIDALFEGFQEGIWNGVVRAAESFDVNLLCFVGGPLLPNQTEKTVYDLISKDLVDAIVVSSGSMGSLVGNEELAAQYRRHSPMPIVSISTAVPGLPSLVVDNETGVRQLMAHLLQFHGRKRVAFIRGPETSPEAEARFKAYRDSLQEHGLSLDPSLVVAGDFNRNAGIDAVVTLLDERKVGFDAIVAANDYMATYAMKELQRRGYAVPEDIAVAGFDDVADAMGVLPSLTTVSQPMHEIGQDAVKKALALMRGESVPNTTLFPTTLVPRRSCGCIQMCNGDDPERYSESTPCGAHGPAELAAALDALFPKHKDWIDRPSWASELANALLDELDDASESRFVLVLESLVLRGLTRQMSSSQWYQVVGALFREVRRNANGPAAERLERIWEASLIMLGGMGEQAQMALRIKSKEEFKILPRIFVVNDIDEEEVKRGILSDLPALGIPSFYLSRYTDKTQEHASLFVHYASSGHVSLDPSPGIFPSTRLIPGTFREENRYAYLVLPLHSRAEQTGFALCELTSLGGAAYQALNNQIGAALKVTSLMQEVRRHASELEAKVDERTHELKEAQQRLLETARQAGMAEIAVGLLHNLGNLFSSVAISAEEIRTIMNGLKVDGLTKATEILNAHRDNLASFLETDPRGRLLPEYYEKALAALCRERDHVQEEVGQLLAKTSLIRESIKALQESAKGGRESFANETIEIPVVVEAVVKIHETHLKKYHVVVRRDFADARPIVTQGSKVVHVLINVIKNAIEAMQSNPEENRLLTIQIQPDSDNRVRVRISDTGKGISRETLAKLFAYGFTTRASGYGFGLHACARYMKEIGGSITAESPGEGQGSTFTMVFGSMS